MSDIQAIKDKLELVAYIEQCGVGLKKSGKYLKACCPFHTERTPSFMVDAEKQTWRCYGACAAGGDIFEFAMKRYGWTFPEALEELARLAGVELKPRDPVENATNERLYGLIQEATGWFQRALLTGAGTPAREYLKSRGLVEATVKAWQIGFAPGGQQMSSELRTLGYSDEEMLNCGLLGKRDDGTLYERFRQRIIYPLCDRRGRVVGFAGRRMHEQDEPKYLNSPQTPIFNKSTLLYGYDRALEHIRRDGSAVVVEGYMDTLQAHQAGFCNVIAEMGTALTGRQLEMLKPATRIFLALDGDAAGQQAAQRSVNELAKLNVDVRVMGLPAGSDPDDLIRAGGWQDALNTAEPLADYLIRTRARITEKTSDAERVKIARSLMPVLTQVEDTLLQRLNVEKLAQALHINEAHLYKEATPLRVVAKPPAVRNLIEAYLLRAFLDREGFYLQVCDELREIGLRGVEPDDFTSYRREMQAVYEAFQQIDMEAIDYVQQQIGELHIPDDGTPLTDHEVLAAAFRLRLIRLMREVDELIELGDLAAARDRTYQKARLLKRQRK